MKFEFRSAARAVALAIAFGAIALAQGTLADYERAQGLQAKARTLVIDQPGTPNWIGESDHFWYAKTVKGGHEFVWVDAAAAMKRPAFDHDKLATAINAASGGHYTGVTLPFAPMPGGRGGGRGALTGPPQTSPLTFKDDEKSIEFGTGGSLYRCQLTDYTCSKAGAIPPPAGRGRGGAPEAEDDSGQPMPMEIGGDPIDGLAWQPFPQQDGGGGRNGHGEPQPPCKSAPEEDRNRRAGRGRGGATATTVGEMGGQILGQIPRPETDVCTSFDGKWDAFIENYNVFLRPHRDTPPPAPPANGRGANAAPEAVPLSVDGSEGNYYTFHTIAWSPDSKHLVAYHTRPGYDRQVHYIESSPADQIQPRHTTIHYAKPGDALDIAYPALFNVEEKSEIELDHALFPTLSTSRRPSGGKMAAASPSSTTSAATRYTACSKWTRTRARSGRLSMRWPRRFSTTAIWAKASRAAVVTGTT